MKTAYSITVFGLTMIMVGCTTSTKVQEMIDASHRDYLAKSAKHEDSIDVLKKSAMTALEKSRENADMLIVLQKRHEAALVQLKTAQDYSDAAKVMSAANTVKVANLQEAVTANKESLDQTVEEMAALDELYEAQLICHFEALADSATAAAEALKAEGMTANTNGPVKLDEPIEIVAPDTSVPANDAPAE